MLPMRAAISYCVRHAFSQAFSVAIIFVSLCCIDTAHALIIGDIEVDSRVGEPLLAHVPISPESQNEKVTTSSLSLIKAGISPRQKRQNLLAARLELEGNKNIGQRIKISTAENVDVSAIQKPDEKGVLQKLELNGSVRAGYFSSSRKLDGKKDLGTGSVWLKAAPNFGEDVSLVAQGCVRNDESFRASGGSEKLQEGYLNFSAGNADYRIGRQIIVWGRADRLNPTDNLTPRNFTLLTPEDDDQRMGSLAAKITYHSQENSLTGIWLPDMDPNVFPVAATPGIFFTEHIPHANQFALKFDRSGSDVDWSTSYFSGLDLNPDIAIGATTPSGTNLIFEHNRIRILGMDAATVIGRYGLRAEAAYTWTANAGVNDFLVKKPFFYMVMGGDRTFFDYLNVNIQYYLRQVKNYSDPQAIANPLLRSVAIQGAVLSNQFDRFQHGITIRVSDKWLNETLEGEIAAVASFGRSNYFIRPKLVYAFSDNIKGSLGLDIYRGESNTFFGQLRNSSLLFAEMKYGF